MSMRHVIHCIVNAAGLLPRGAGVDLPEQAESLEAVPEDYRRLYAEAEDEGEGKVYRLVPGARVLLDQIKQLKSKVDEFRGTNRSLAAQMKDMEKRMAGIDPEAYKKGMEALDKLREIDEQGLIKEGKVDEVIEKRVAARVEAMRRDAESQVRAKDEVIAQHKQEVQSLRSRLGALLIDTQVQTAVNEVGKPRPGAMTDIVARARSTFHITDTGEVQPRDQQGELRYGKDGQPLTFKEWAAELLTSAPHLFESPQGGGAGGGQKGNTANGRVRVIPKDPVLIGRYAEEIRKGTVVVEGTV